MATHSNFQSFFQKETAESDHKCSVQRIMKEVNSKVRHHWDKFREAGKDDEHDSVGESCLKFKAEGKGRRGPESMG